MLLFAPPGAWFSIGFGRWPAHFTKITGFSIGGAVALLSLMNRLLFQTHDISGPSTLRSWHSHGESPPPTLVPPPAIGELQWRIAIGISALHSGSAQMIGGLSF